MYVLIPAYEPTSQLPALVAQLRETAPALEILIVDDGSGDGFGDVFAAAEDAGARVITHPVNRGKGAALKTGFAEIGARAPGVGVVTADADGQHMAVDIVAVAAAVAERDGALVLGVREFRDTAPVRSRLGNAVARTLFQLATGRRISDTQTGLRGISGDRIAWALSIPGDGFEYEQRMLLRVAPDAVALTEVPIETVYLGRNESSHFRPVRDSLRVLAPLALFTASSLAAFVVDTLALLVLNALTGWLVASIVVARLLSASVNFVVNRRMVFRAGGTAVPAQAARYALLAAALLASNIAWMSFLTDAGLALLPAKAVTEGVLFILSYGVQRSLVFAPAIGPDIARPSPPVASAPFATSAHPGRNR
ncbi:glycosyltransferase [Microbacterium lacticum]